MPAELASGRIPHTVRYDIAEADGTAFLMLERLQGQTLADRLGRRLPLDEAVKIALNVVDALSAAHKQGVPRSSEAHGRHAENWQIHFDLDLPGNALTGRWRERGRRRK